MNNRKQFLMDNKLIFISFAVFVVFHLFFEKYITTLFVDTFFYTLESSLLNDWIAIFLVLLIICHLIKLISLKSYISNQIIILSSLLFLIIGYYRFLSDIWTFTSMSFCQCVKYIDVLFLFLMTNIVIRFTNRKKEYLYNKADGFLFDNPIEKTRDDKLNRNSIAGKLVWRIKNTANSHTAFAIGICSEWGHGKTSFLNLVEYKLYTYCNKCKNCKDYKNRIIVHFNPWLNNDECSIITTFFDELSEKLKPYNRELSKDLIEYADILNATENNFIEKTLNYFKSNSDNLKRKFDSINHKIKNSGKQIVVFIDDLDRLYEKEILEVLRLVRNSANFANTVFVVAYDRNYLISALKKTNEYRPNFYLEKIFQLEIMLPKFENFVFVNKLKTALWSYLTEKDRILLDEKFKSIRHNAFKYSLFSNIRDINRFVNSFILSYELLKDEIDLVDLLNLELLRIKYLGVYYLLSKDYNSFLENAKYSNGIDFHLTLKMLKDEKDTIITPEKTVLEEYLETYYNDVAIQRTQINNVLEYVLNIFPRYGNQPNNPLLSILNPIAIERYFHYNLLNSNLSEIEFSKHRQKSEQEFQTKINEWVHKGKYNEVAARLERINLYQNKEDYEKIINTIFFFASLLKSDGRCLGFDHSYLFQKLQYNSVKQFYTEYEFKVFVKELFNRQTPPYLFVSEFIKNIFHYSCREWQFEEIVTKEELISQKLTYFKQYSESIDKIDRYFFWLYHYCSYTECINRGDNSWYSQEVSPSQYAKDIFIACATRLTDNFLKNIISAEVLSEKQDNTSFGIVKIVSTIWGGWENFETFLLELDENQILILNEFKDFFNKYKKVNFVGHIEYTFKDIDLSDALLFNE